MSIPAMPSERDLRTLAGIVSDHRADLPPHGLPLSLLAELTGQIRCDLIAFHGYDSEREKTWFLQHRPGGEDLVVEQDWDALFWQHYWNCQPCSYPDRAGDLRSIVKIADFYSSRQWHSTGMYYCRSWGWSTICRLLTLPAAPSPVSGPGRTLRLFFFRGPGADFSEHDRALLVLLRPHLHQAYLDAERRRHPVPQLTPGRTTCCTCWPPGTPTPRSPAAWAYPREPCAPTWRTSTKGCMFPAAPPPSPAPFQTGLPSNSMTSRAECAAHPERTVARSAASQRHRPLEKASAIRVPSWDPLYSVRDHPHQGWEHRNLHELGPQHAGGHHRRPCHAPDLRRCV